MLNVLRDGLIASLGATFFISLRTDFGADFFAVLRAGFLTRFFKRILNATAGNKAPPFQ